MSNPRRLFIRHLVIFLFTVTVVLGYTSKAISTNLNTEQTLNTYAIDNYTALNQMLPFFQAATEHPWPTLPGYILLKPGKKNPAVLLLREQLKANGEIIQPNLINPMEFDGELAEEVKSFQMRHGLKSDGVVGEITRSELNIPPQIRLKQIQKNIERWQKISQETGNRFLLVNVPEFEVRLIDNNMEVLNMKAIVGKPERPTPELVSKITRLVFNPYWHVPTKIARKDLLRKIKEDPTYLDEMNIHVFVSGTNRTQELNSAAINWEAISEEDLDFDFRQDPGEKNSLGVVKFEFPNSYDVYLHDTPAKELFDSDVRDLSSGCIRLEKPFELVDYLIRENPKWDELRIQDVLLSQKTTYVSIPRPIPIVLTYITAWVDSNGKLNFRNDIYHRDE